MFVLCCIVLFPFYHACITFTVTEVNMLCSMYCAPFNSMNYMIIISFITHAASVYALHDFIAVQIHH